MKRLRLPSTLVFVLSTGAAAFATGCGKDAKECIPCLPDPRLVDAGADAPDAVPCPDCLPEDGVCPIGCVPEGFA